MPRIPYPDMDKLPEVVRKMLAGTPINVVRMAAHASPALFQAEGMLGYAISNPENLDPKLREVAVLRVAYLCRSKYELHQHLSIARAVGLSEEDIDAIGAAHYSKLEPRFAAVARFTDEVVTDVSPSDQALATLRSHVSDQVLINITLTIGHYLSVARLIAVSGVEPDEEALHYLPVSADDQAR